MTVMAIGISAFGVSTKAKQGTPVDGPEFAKPGMVAYAASYSSNVTDEPKYSTQNNKTFQYLDLGSTLSYYRGDSVKVGIIDSGINYDHEDFMVNSSTKVKGDSKYYAYSNSQWVYYKASQHGYSYIDDSLGHGTNVAATVAAAVNGVGGLGLAPNVELYVYKVTNSNNGYEFGAIQNALMDAVTLKLDVVNMSFQSYEHAVSYGGSSMAASSGCSTILSYYLNQAYNAGITLVGAAGNYNTSEPSYPGSNDHVINVGSLNQTATDKAGFSNYGSTIDLVAPGYVHVADKGNSNAYKDTSGTSFSAPLVTAAIALYKQKNPSATPSQIESALYAACDEIDDSGSAHTNWAGHGALNVSKFLDISDNGPTEIVINNPEIQNDELELEVGDTFDLDWTVNGQGTFSSDVEFELYNDNGVISVNSNGRITALKAGQEILSIVSTHDSSVSADIYITVTSSSVTPTLTLSPSSVSLEVGDTQQLTAQTYPSATITYTSSDSTVASVSNSGLITAKKAGSATISASANNLTEQCLVTVTDPVSNVPAGTYTILPSHFTTAYQTTDTSTSFPTFDVKANNVMDTNDKGTHYIQVKSTPGYIFNTVPVNIESITINGIPSGFGNFTVYGGTSEKPSTSITGTNNTYQFSNTQKYFKISCSGTARATSITIVVGDGKVLSSIAVKTVPTKLTYEVGQYFDPTGLVITGTYEGGSTKDITYANNTSLFSFAPSLSTQLTKTNESVTITYNGKSCSQAITVKDPVTLSSISISGQTTAFIEGDAFSFGGTVTAHYSDSTSENVTASATFSGYTMTTTGEQTVTVSYTYKGTTKTTTYTITVGKGTLSSIAVSGQTTVYQKNATFSFDGTCTATFTNGYQKAVTPTEVTSPDMTTSGVKTITVSYTYNGKTVSTTYDITVQRKVYEETTEERYSTITWPTSSTANISGDLEDVTASVSGKTNYESSSMRLGTGSGGGTLTITSSNKITKVTVSAKYYSSSYSSSVLKVDGQSVSSLTSSYKEYTVTLSSSKTSFTILTENSNSRVNIQSVKIYKTVTTETDISNTDDCVGLETFISTYMHMDYTENLGYCNDAEHHYYETAKVAFNILNDHQRSLFTGNTAYSAEWERLRTWASINGDHLDSNNKLVNTANMINPISNNGNEVIIVMMIITILLIPFGLYLFRRKEQ